MTKAVFVTARLGSSRLPRKHLLKILDKYCIEYVLERAKRSKSDRVILCTTNLEEDKILCDIAGIYGVDYYQGNVIDKLDRWLCAADHFGVDFFVTADADDLFCEPELMNLAFSQHNLMGDEFIEWDESELICGSFTYGIKTEALRKACELKKSNDTEMIWAFFDSATKSKLLNVPDVFRRPEIRATLDYVEDFEFFRNVIEHFGHNDFSLRDVVEYIDANPSVIEINRFRHLDWKNNQIKKVEEINGNQRK